MPADIDDVFMRRGVDYSPRLLLLTPTEAWALPTVSGKSDADPVNDGHHRLSWSSLVKNGHLPSDAVIDHRHQLLGACNAAPRPPTRLADQLTTTTRAADEGALAAPRLRSWMHGPDRLTSPPPFRGPSRSRVY